MNFSDTMEKTPRDKVVPERFVSSRSMLSSSASAQGLRCLDGGKVREESSPTGVLKGCTGSLESSNGETEFAKASIHCLSSKSVSHWRMFFSVWKKRSLRRIPSFPAVSKISRRKGRNTKENIDPLLCRFVNKDICKNFSFADLQNATNNFDQENMIGRGGYAEVFQGRLQDGKLVAIKRLTRGTPEEQTAGFLSELGIVAHVNHSNVAKLIGCGVEGGMHLVFQLSPLGSLGSLLHGSREKLNWGIRYKIALGTADGLLYLHENCQRRIIHRDIKSENILLTEDFEPQICDFGLAKWLPEQWTHHNVSRFEGTFGYFAPEYFMHGIVDEKTDIYSFGVLLLELITGRRALDHLQQSVVVWAKPLLDRNQISKLVDPSLGNAYDLEEMGRVVMTASLCVQQSPILRPRMSQVLTLLRGDHYIPDTTKEWRKKSLRRTYSEELMDAEEYNYTKHLNDLNRHKQVALGSENQ